MYHTTVCSFISGIEEGVFYSNLQKQTSTQVGPPVSYENLASLLKNISQNNPEFKNVDILFEYNPPMYGGYCDVVIVGQKKGIPAAYFIELKDWNNVSCVSWKTNDGIHIDYRGNATEHPAAQVKGYVEACQNTHSAFVAPYGNPPVTKGGVFFTAMSLDDPAAGKSWKNDEFNDLTSEYQVWGTDNNSKNAFKDDIISIIDQKDFRFCNAFIQGYFKQSKNLHERLGQALDAVLHGSQDGVFLPFANLVNEQEIAYKNILTQIKNAILENSPKKHVFVIKGQPGSGKTAVAANLLIGALRISRENDVNGNIIFTSSSTNSATWKSALRVKGLKHILKLSNKINPGLHGGKQPTYMQLFAPEFRDLLLPPDDGQNNPPEKFDASKWREIFDVVRTHKIKDLEEYLSCQLEENMYHCVICDEAHSLVKRFNDETGEAIDSSRIGGWYPAAGPQAYYIIYSSKVSVFLMEDAQGIQDREKTKVEDIEKYATYLNAEYHFIELKEQFRCGGSREYIDWVSTLTNESPLKNHKDWKDKFHTSIVDYPAELDKFLVEKINQGNMVRLLSTYSVPWITKNLSVSAKATLDFSQMDFYFKDGDGQGNPWGKCWNSPGQFIVPTTNVNMLTNSLFEVGYPQEIRGWDFDYLGILWLDDLVWREEGGWGIRANMTEDAPFRGKEAGPWFGPFQDDAVASSRKAAEKEFNSLKKSMNNEINSLKKSLKALNSSLGNLERRLSRCNRIDVQRELQQQITEIKNDISFTEEKLKEKESKWQEFLTVDKIIFKHPDFPKVNELIDGLFRIYRILLTRALKGNVIYVKDPETRDHLRDLLK